MSESACFPKADLGFDPTPRAYHCWHPLAPMGVPFTHPDGMASEREFCCRCHAVQETPHRATGGAS